MDHRNQSVFDFETLSRHNKSRWRLCFTTLQTASLCSLLSCVLLSLLSKISPFPHSSVVYFLRLSKMVLEKAADSLHYITQCGKRKTTRRGSTTDFIWTIDATLCCRRVASLCPTIAADPCDANHFIQGQTTLRFVCVLPLQPSLPPSFLLLSDD